MKGKKMSQDNFIQDAQSYIVFNTGDAGDDTILPDS